MIGDAEADRTSDMATADLLLGIVARAPVARACQRRGGRFRPASRSVPMVPRANTFVRLVVRPITEISG